MTTIIFQPGKPVNVIKDDDMLTHTFINGIKGRNAFIYYSHIDAWYCRSKTGAKGWLHCPVDNVPKQHIATVLLLS